jgi:cytochrome c556
MKMRTLTLASVLVAAGLALMPLALAQSPQQVHESRVVAMKDIGANLRTINESQKNLADHPKIVAAATKIRDHAKNISSWFPPGTDMAALPDGGKNHAKPEIWQAKADFDAAAKALETEAATMIQLASGNDNNAVQEQFKKLGASCGGCHSKFRSPLQ